MTPERLRRDKLLPELSVRLHPIPERCGAACARFRVVTSLQRKAGAAEKLRSPLSTVLAVTVSLRSC